MYLNKFNHIVVCYILPQVLLNIYQRVRHHNVVKMINKVTKVEDPYYNPSEDFVILLFRDM